MRVELIPSKPDKPSGAADQRGWKPRHEWAGLSVHVCIWCAASHACPSWRSSAATEAGTGLTLLWRTLPREGVGLGFVSYLTLLPPPSSPCLLGPGLLQESSSWPPAHSLPDTALYACLCYSLLPKAPFTFNPPFTSSWGSHP